LLAGVELCGKGNWTEILNRFKEKFDKQRTAQNLNNKYWLLTKTDQAFEEYREKVTEILLLLNGIYI
jgi:hypothetical protein